MLKKLKFVGGQNPIEAAKNGCKIFMVPLYITLKKFIDY